MQKCFTQRGFVVATTVQPCPPAHKLVRIWMCNRDGADYWMGRQLPKTFSFLSVLLSSLMVFSRTPVCACWSVSSVVGMILAAQSPEWMAGILRSWKPQSVCAEAYCHCYSVHITCTHYMQPNEPELAKDCRSAITPCSMWAGSEPQQFAVMEVRNHCFYICQTSW